MHPRSYHRQQGVALAISLILLAALTILGVATLTSARFQEQITSNAQQKAVSFEAAESAINTLLVNPSMIVDTIRNVPSDQYNNPDPVFPPGLDARLSEGFDQTNAHGKSVDITSRASVQYCGERALMIGSELSGDTSRVRLVAMMFDVNGQAEMNNSNARSDHVQRASLARPETERSGACVTPTP